jgi:hypothetical protein
MLKIITLVVDTSEDSATLAEFMEQAHAGYLPNGMRVKDAKVTDVKGVQESVEYALCADFESGMHTSSGYFETPEEAEVAKDSDDEYIQKVTSRRYNSQHLFVDRVNVTAKKA